MSNRYSRQTLFTPIGKAGQKKIRNKHVLIVGLGTLGTQSAEMLVRAGIGMLTIVDRDYIEWSNLQRQQLFTETDAQEQLPKAIAAKQRLKILNSEVDINAHIMDVTPLELQKLIEDVDLILDGTDNFDIRMMINDISQKFQIPWIYGSCVGSYGMTYSIIPEEGPCLHCLLETVPVGGPTCDTVGIIHPAASQVVVYQTTEALKIITEDYKAMRKELISFDLWKNETVQLNVASLKNVNCPSCSPEADYPFLSMEEQTKSAVLCGRDSVQIRPPKRQERNLNDLARQLEETGGQVDVNDFLLSFTIKDERMVIFKDGRALVHGTNDVKKAHTLYHRYFS